MVPAGDGVDWFSASDSSDLSPLIFAGCHDASCGPAEYCINCIFGGSTLPSVDALPIVSASVHLAGLNHSAEFALESSVSETRGGSPSPEDSNDLSWDGYLPDQITTLSFPPAGRPSVEPSPPPSTILPSTSTLIAPLPDHQAFDSGVPLGSSQFLEIPFPGRRPGVSVQDDPPLRSTKAVSSLPSLVSKAKLQQEPSSADLPGLPCPFRGCNERFTKQAGLLDHQTSKHSYRCQRGCSDTSFTTARGLDRHYDTDKHASTSLPYSCGCGHRTPAARRDNHRRHLKKCNEAFTSIFICACGNFDTWDRKQHETHIGKCKRKAGRPRNRKKRLET